MEKTKTPRDSAFITRKIVKPDELNPNGTLFGGIIMSWIDEVAFMSARRYSGRPFVVTASIDNITFLTPLNLGDHVILTSSVNFAGRSSMEIGVKVEKENPYTGERVRATSAYLTFVALGKNGKPTTVPKLKPETTEDYRRFEEAKLRVKIRARLRHRLRRKLSQSTFDPHTIEINSLGQAPAATPSETRRNISAEASKWLQQQVGRSFGLLNRVQDDLQRALNDAKTRIKSHKQKAS